MFWKRKGKTISDEADPVPDQSPPVVAASDEGTSATGHRRRIWLWVLAAGLAIVLMVVFVLVLGVIGFYDGLRDRASVGWACRPTVQRSQQRSELHTTVLCLVEKGQYLQLSYGGPTPLDEPRQSPITRPFMGAGQRVDQIG